jgi:hypothetical protein
VLSIESIPFLRLCHLAGHLGRFDEALPKAEEAYGLATVQGFTNRAQELRLMLGLILLEINTRIVNDDETRSATPPQAGHPEWVTQPNTQYQQELARWKALPWWKRLIIKEPDPPEET